MGRCAPPAMAAAVANAGGLGMLGVSWDSLPALEQHLRSLSDLTDKDIAFNFCLEMDQNERIQFALDNGVKVFSLFWGDPTPFVDRIKSAGGKVMVSVGSVAHAKRAVAAGADAICAQGFEAGGHVYAQTGGLALIPAIVDAVGDTPVVAAGGFADGRGLAAALSLGAGGIWLGTRFLATTESNAHPDYINRILAAGHDATLVTELFDLSWPRAPHRVIRNSTYDLWESCGKRDGDDRPGSDDIIARRAGQPVYRYDASGPTTDLAGDVEPMAHYAGQSAGFVNAIESCADVVAEIVAEAQSTLAALCQSHRA